MAEQLPAFPLSIIAFPEENVNLHIFEPRYRQLFAECEAEGKPFVLVPVIDNRLCAVGTVMELASVAKRYESGELDVHTRGVRKVSIEGFEPVAEGKLYGAVTAGRIYDDGEASIFDVEKLVERIERLYEAMQVQVKFSLDPRDFSTYTAGHHVGFNTLQEYQLLQMHSEQARVRFMMEHLGKLLPVVEQTEKLKERVRLNGHFKDLKPPDFTF